MAGNVIRDSLSPPAGLRIQTTKLADNVQSLTAAVQMLQATVRTVQSSRPEVQQKLAPILAQSVTPLLAMGQQAEADLRVVAARMADYIQEVANATVQTKTLAALDLTNAFTGVVIVLLTRATAVKMAAANTSLMLTNYETAANRATAALNTFSTALDRQNQDLQREAQSLQQQMHDMTSGNCCEQIGHAFEMAFGHLRDELEADDRKIQSLEYVYAINLNALDGLRQIVSEMGDISAVSSSLELSWRSLADGIVVLHDDLASVLADTTQADIQADLEYVQSDWQSISATLGKIA